MRENIAEITRGRIINKVTTLEFLVDLYLAKYFSNEEIKRSELVYLVFSAGRVTFENKRLIFKYLAEKYNPGFIQNNPSFHKDLGTIIEHRNIFAHYPFTEGDTEGMLKLRNNFEIIEYSKEKLEEIQELMDKYIQIFSKELNM